MTSAKLAQLQEVAAATKELLLAEWQYLIYVEDFDRYWKTLRVQLRRNGMEDSEIMDSLDWLVLAREACLEVVRHCDIAERSSDLEIAKRQTDTIGDLLTIVVADLKHAHHYID